MKLTELFNERSLTKSEEDNKEDFVKGMKKNKGDFEKRYGKEAKAVMYATATKMAKNEDVNEVLSDKGRENLRRLIHEFESKAEDMNLSQEAMDAVAMGLDQIMSDVQEIEGVRENKTPGDSHYHKEKAKELAKKDGKDPERLSYGELMDYIKKAQLMDSSHNQESVEEAPGAKQLVGLKKRYDELTDENQHGQAALELSQVLGDSDEVALLKAINARHEKRGSISRGEQTLRDEIANAHYKTMMQGMFPIDESLTEAQFDEKAGEKDACYHKVKSRYKVWPSAYASGALSKCRKVGAANWGKSKKK